MDNGKIIIGGDFSEYNGVAVNKIVRLNSDGTIDPAFSVTGNFNNAVNKIVEDPLTRGLYVTGFFTEFDSANVGGIVKLNEEGSKNTLFNVGTGADGSIITTKLFNDGTLILGGYFSNFNSNPHPGIVKINSIGIVDVDFQIGSGVTSGQGVHDIYIYPDNKLLVGGNFTSFNGSSFSNVIKLNSDGSINNGFSGAPDFNGTVNGITVQQDGKIIIGAFNNFSLYNGVACKAILRINADGSFDNSFDAGTGCASVYTVLSFDNNTFFNGR